MTKGEVLVEGEGEDETIMVWKGSLDNDEVKEEEEEEVIDMTGPLGDEGWPKSHESLDR